MRRPLSKRKCQHCKTFFEPDPRSAGRQHYCATPACRKASKALPVNAVGCNNRATVITSVVPSMSSASGSGARPTRGTGAARPLACPMRYKNP